MPPTITGRHPLGLAHDPNAYATDGDDNRRTFYTSRGWLNAYALACGYMEAVDVAGVRVTLGAECGVVHVRAHDHGTPERRGAGRLAWWTWEADGPGMARARARFLAFAHGLEAVTDHPAQVRAWCDGTAALHADLATGGDVPHGPDDQVAVAPTFGIAGTRVLATVERDGGTWYTWADGTRTYAHPAGVLA